LVATRAALRRGTGAVAADIVVVGAAVQGVSCFVFDGDAAAVGVAEPARPALVAGVGSLGGDSADEVRTDFTGGSTVTILAALRNLAFPVQADQARAAITVVQATFLLLETEVACRIADRRLEAAEPLAALIVLDVAGLVGLEARAYAGAGVDVADAAGLCTARIALQGAIEDAAVSLAPFARIRAVVVVGADASKSVRAAEARWTADCRARVLKTVESASAVTARLARVTFFRGTALVFKDDRSVTATSALDRLPIRNVHRDALALIRACFHRADIAGVAIRVVDAFHTDVDAADRCIFRAVVVDAAIRQVEEDAVAAESIHPGTGLKRNAEQALRFFKIFASRAGWAVGVTAARARPLRLTDVVAALLAGPAIAVETASCTRCGILEEKHISGRIGAANAAWSPYDGCSARYPFKIAAVVKTATGDFA
jgi:hypothetical protein